MKKLLEASFVTAKEGEILKASVIKKTDNGVLLNDDDAVADMVVAVVPYHDIDKLIFYAVENGAGSGNQRHGENNADYC